MVDKQRKAAIVTGVVLALTALGIYLVSMFKYLAR
jgi:hypothetical protein